LISKKEGERGCTNSINFKLVITSSAVLTLRKSQTKMARLCGICMKTLILRSNSISQPCVKLKNVLNAFMMLGGSVMEAWWRLKSGNMNIG